MDEGDDQTTNDAPPLLAGRWRLEGMIGAGGMGAVYRARDLELGETVALKVLTHVEPASLARFREEVRLARKVTHRNVARTYDIGEDAGTRFLTMEYVEGTSLRRLIAAQKPDAARARDLARQICAGLAAVHEQGLAHGDIKPENILVSPSGEAKLSDFGLARVADRRETGDSPGTPSYMAPEQLGGNAADARTDVYAFGVVVYELFTGRRPWDATPAALLERLASPPPPIPDDVPADVATLIERCLASDPAGRPDDARAILATMDVPPPPETQVRLSTHPRNARPDRSSMHVAVRALSAEDPEDAYLAIALASDLARLLGGARQLEVQTALLPPGGAAPGDVVIEGNLRRLGMSLRIALRAISSRDGYLVWARAGEVSLGDALAELTQAATAIAAALSATAPIRPRVLTTSDPSTLDLYLRARCAEDRAWEAIEIDDCVLFAELLERLPEDPLVLASYAIALSRRAGRVPGVHVRAREMAEKALRLAPDLAEAHLALALVVFLAHDNEAAARAAAHAAQLSPSLGEAQSLLGTMLCEVGRVEEGLGRLDLALALEPRLTISWSVALLRRGWADDDAAFHETLGRAPKSSVPSAEWLYWLTRLRAANYRAARAPEEAAEAAAALRRTPWGGIPPLHVLPRVVERTASIGDVEAAIAPFLAGEPSLVRAQAMGLAALAEAAAVLDDREALRGVLDRFDATSSCDVAWLDRCPLFAGVRDLPWFAGVRERVAARARRLDDTLRRIGLDAS